MEFSSLEPYERAILRLQELLVRYQSAPGDDGIRDGLIQRFEYVYELSHKTIRRYLAFVSASPDQYDQMSFPTLIRTANQQGLLMGEWRDWHRYRELRSKSSHTYAEQVALEVAGAIPKFLEEVIYLSNQLRDRLQ